MTLLLLFQSVGGPPPSPVDVSLRGLLCVERTTQADFLAFIAAFDVLIAGQDGLTSTVLDYLDQDTGDGELTVEDRDYWLDLILQRAGYTGSRLPWGSAAPLTLSQADPLGLTSNPNAIIIDPDAIDDGNPSSTTGVVKVTYGGGSTNPCTLLDGTPKSPADLFSDGAKTIYRYRLWDNLQNLNETGGASSARFPSNGGRVTVYVRASVNTHILSRELELRKASTHTHADSITIRSYPGERAIVRMGNSLVAAGVLNDISPTSMGTIAGSLRLSMVRLGGSSAGLERNNVHFRTLHLKGNRPLVGIAGQCFASTMIEYSSLSSGSVKDVMFTDFTFLEHDDYNKDNFSIFDDIVDTRFDLRVSNLQDPVALKIQADNVITHKNYYRGVDENNWPNAFNSKAADVVSSSNIGGFLAFTTLLPHNITVGEIISVKDHTGFTATISKNGDFTVGSVPNNTTIVTTTAYTGTNGTGGQIRVKPKRTGNDSYCIDIGSVSVAGLGDNCQVTQSKIEGVCAVGVRIRGVNNVTVQYNNVQAYCNSGVYFEEVTNSILQLNRIISYGVEDYGYVDGEHGLQLGTISGCTIQYNVISNREPMNNSFGYGIWQKRNGTNNTYRRNLIYRHGMYIDVDSGNTMDGILVQENLIVGMKELLKTRDSGIYNAPIRVNLQGEIGDTPGTLNGSITLQDNGLWRMTNSDPLSLVVESGPHLVIKHGATYDPFEVDDPLTGWTGNYLERPIWLGNPEWPSNDFRISTASEYAALFPPEMPLLSTPAWNESPLTTLCAIDFFLFTTTPNLGEFTTDDNAGDILTLANVGDFTTVESVT